MVPPCCICAIVPGGREVYAVSRAEVVEATRLSLSLFAVRSVEAGAAGCINDDAGLAVAAAEALRWWSMSELSELARGGEAAAAAASLLVLGNPRSSAHRRATVPVRMWRLRVDVESAAEDAPKADTPAPELALAAAPSPPAAPPRARLSEGGTDMGIRPVRFTTAVMRMLRGAPLPPTRSM